MLDKIVIANRGELAFRPFQVLMARWATTWTLTAPMPNASAIR